MAYELFIDGFDHYATADIGRKWPIGSGGAIVAGEGRRGTSALNVTSSGRGVAVTQSTRGVIAAAVKLGNNLGAARGWFAAYDGATSELDLIVTSDQKIAVRRGSTVLATSTNALAQGIYAFIEFGFNINNSGSFEVRVNGTSAGWIPPTNADTQQSANARFTNLYISFSNPIGHIDDCYLTYGDEIKFLGDCRVDTLALTANASPQDWTPDTGNAWERLNQDAGYISSDTINATSLFAAGNLSHNPSTIHGVQVVGHAYKTDAGSREAAMVLKSGTTTDVGTSLALSTDTLLIREPHIVNPDTGVAFTKAGVDGMEVGVKVTA